MHAGGGLFLPSYDDHAGPCEGKLLIHFFYFGGSRTPVMGKLIKSGHTTSCIFLLQHDMRNMDPTHPVSLSLARLMHAVVSKCPCCKSNKRLTGPCGDDRPFEIGSVESKMQNKRGLRGPFLGRGIDQESVGQAVRPQTQPACQPAPSCHRCQHPMPTTSLVVHRERVRVRGGGFS